MGGRADLHCHTTASDGACTPRELLRRAAQAGLTAVGITDHDSVGGIEEGIEEGRKLGITVIPGIELSATLRGADIHILGYFVDHRDAGLEEYLVFLRSERVKRAERIVEKLQGLQIPLRIESVLERAGRGAVGRPHIANALVDEGLTGSYNEAFWKYIGFGKPAYEDKYQISPSRAVQIIASAGGLSFIAHPGAALDERTLLDLLHEGVDGIEVVHPSHSPERVAYYRGVVARYGLLASGGSDFHGGRRNDDGALGAYGISAEELSAMRRRLASRGTDSGG
jgi:predicted metal-dependent phosphoesterase TrpH